MESEPLPHPQSMTSIALSAQTSTLCPLVPIVTFRICKSVVPKTIFDIDISRFQFDVTYVTKTFPLIRCVDGA